LCALALVIVVSVPLGMLTAEATRDGRNPRLEAVFTTVTSLSGSIPEFLMSTFLALIFAVWLRLLPIAGGTGPESLVLPALALAIAPATTIARIVRLETLNTLRQDYMRTARSKQLPTRLLYARHALPNVLNATLTISGALFTALIGSAVVVENVFARAGVGSLMVHAIQDRDYPVVQGVTLFIGALVVIVNALVDVAIATTDPRYMAEQVPE
jgi:peptide/nickel transport system permease protein